MALTLSISYSQFKPSGLVARSHEQRIGFRATFLGAGFDAIGSIADAVVDDGLQQLPDHVGELCRGAGQER